MYKITVIQGLQYGSEAKGAIAGAIARNWKPDTVVTAWGPNAGHTVREGEFKFVSTMLATGALYPSTRAILIGPGSVVDFTKLAQEIELAGERLRDKRMIIHPRAAYLKPMHAELERSLLRIGSTMKGTMQAQVSKMHRVETAVVEGAKEEVDKLRLAALKVGLHVSTSEQMYDDEIDDSRKMLIEGAQGYSLSMHGPFYPYCTSRDVSTLQTLADCRIPMLAYREAIRVVGVLRTYPIRVANRRSEDGQEYTSGGFYGDQHEIDWKDLGREPELTTVTRLPRRIFSFSYEQIFKAVRQLKPTSLALTFCDYLDEPPAGFGGMAFLGPKARDLIAAIHTTTDLTGHRTRVESVSYGPDAADMYGIVDPESGLLGPAFASWGGSNG